MTYFPQNRPIDHLKRRLQRSV